MRAANASQLQQSPAQPRTQGVANLGIQTGGVPAVFPRVESKKRGPRRLPREDGRGRRRETIGLHSQPGSGV